MKSRYFRRLDPLIYLGILGVFLTLGWNIIGMEVQQASKVEVYVDGDLKHVYNLQMDQRFIDVDTNLGGIKLELKDNQVRVVTSNSPLKLIVKQGWAKYPGDTLIGIPDRAVVKIVGKGREDDVDFILR
ncbi:hypothetical protein PM10SUCC1_35200 [Propionigenium maris DSM 9537]|uniref:NusG domain-containing protein n=1 Tax=Propionigenium maris DSM 9537 TaxID=1123000 RepID=A0A9W6LP39_9FUSO|nr:NusG domain II-containing protein [Propionigenium maris]GLI58006.1 hypothetical protein PM10SUCC1_35200 [Propionigenium maris DSM 9537]